MDFPDEMEAINGLQSKIIDAWELLTDKSQWRKLQLEQTVDLFRLLLLVENHVLWINDMYDDINNLEEPRYIIFLIGYIHFCMLVKQVFVFFMDFYAAMI